MKKIILRNLIIVALIFLTIIFAGYKFLQTHFLYGTIIDNVPCSFLTIEQAIEKIYLEKSGELKTFCFSNGKTYAITAEELGIRVDEAHIKKIFKQQHSKPKQSRKYDLNGFILIDEKLLRNFFSQIPELQEENMNEPQNPYIFWGETEFLIQEEQLGNVIDFEKAIKFSMSKIRENENQVNFEPITKIIPEIAVEDLISEQESLNSIVKSSINFELSNNEIVTFDVNTIKDWITQDENGKFSINIDQCVYEFVEQLAVRINEVNSNMQFVPTDCEHPVTVNVPADVRAQLDKEAQIASIKEMLGNPDPIFTKPIYDRALISDILLTSRIEIDITRQHIWFYKDGNLILETPCVTGNISQGYDTPTGVFFLKNKNLGVYLEGYNNDGSKYSSFVKYWMRFYEGYGMHDASWRYSFGGEIYKTGGSHGCVNMPEDAAVIAYENIDETIPIIIYQS